jgi:hypothetical protein
MLKGYAILNAEWKKGDVITVHLPMPVRRVIANEKVQDDRRKVALQRGPMVYCAEGIDNGGEVLNMIVPEAANLQTEYRRDLLNGVTAIKGKAIKLIKSEKEVRFEKTAGNFLAIPYYAWCHRGAGNMTVWFHSERTVFPPMISPAGTLFLNEVTVNLAKYADQEIHYTLDGTTPSLSSPLYEKPITFTGTTTLRALAFGRNGLTSEIETATFTKTSLHPAAYPSNLIPGLRYNYYEGQVDSLPDFATLQPKKTGRVDHIDITSMREVPDHYLLQFTGYIEVPKDGVYTFYLNSDDGSRLLIDDNAVVNNDGTHGAMERSGQIALQAGKHKLALEYFEYDFGEILRVYYSGPGIEKQLVPASVWYCEKSKD